MDSNNSEKRWTYIIVGIFVLIALISVIAGVNGDGGASMGDTVILTNDTMGAASVEDADQLGRYLASGDKIGIMDMMYQGRVRTFSSGTRLHWTAHRGGHKVVRALDDYREWYLVGTEKFKKDE